MTDADRLHLLGVLSDITEDPFVQQQAAANSLDNFGERCSSGSPMTDRCSA